MINFLCYLLISLLLLPFGSGINFVWCGLKIIIVSDCVIVIRTTYCTQQLKLYHEDFERERHAREAAIKVKNLAEERMKKMERSIKELRDRLNQQAARRLSQVASMTLSDIICMDIGFRMISRNTENQESINFLDHRQSRGSGSTR